MMDSVGPFGIVADDQPFILHHSKALHELHGTKRGVSQLEADALEPTLGIESEHATRVDKSAVAKFAIDEFGIIHTNLNPAELLISDRLHSNALPFRLYCFSGSFRDALASSMIP